MVYHRDSPSTDLFPNGDLVSHRLTGRTHPLAVDQRSRPPVEAPGLAVGQPNAPANAELFIQRWSVETTFEEAWAHLGLETQRQWNARTIALLYYPRALGLV